MMECHVCACIEASTSGLKLLKLGARVAETASPVCLTFTATCPEAALIRHIARSRNPGSLNAGGPYSPAALLPETTHAVIKSVTSLGVV